MNYNETLNWMFNKLPMYQRIGAAAYIKAGSIAVGLGRELYLNKTFEEIKKTAKEAVKIANSNQ